MLIQSPDWSVLRLYDWHFWITDVAGSPAPSIITTLVVL
jgi:hypothetical protein